jgi:LmbE family N-acetylglucosaminyl deacetylase
MRPLQPALILSPHCDDVPLSLGAALLARSFGQKPHVCIVFSRSRCTTDFDGDGPEDQITRLRNQEERAAAQRADYDVEFWGFGEPFVRPGFSHLAQLRDQTRPVRTDPAWGPIVASIERVVSKHDGLVMAPLGCGGHVDHRLIHEALIECSLWQRHIRIGFYEDLPYCNSLSEDRILASIPVLPGRQLDPHLVRGGLEEKLSLLEIYRSQLGQEHMHAVRQYWHRRGGERLWVARELHRPQ